MKMIEFSRIFKKSEITIDVKDLTDMEKYEAEQLKQKWIQEKYDSDTIINELIHKYYVERREVYEKSNEIFQYREQLRKIDEELKQSYEEINKINRENNALRSALATEKEKSNEQMQKMQEDLKRMADIQATKDQEERSKEERREARRRYRPEKSYAAKPFKTKEELEIFSKELKEQHFDEFNSTFLFEVLAVSNGLRASTVIKKLKYNEVKRHVYEAEHDKKAVLDTIDSKTGKPNNIRFTDEARRELKEYFLKVEKAGIVIDEDDEKTTLLFNLKESQVNVHLQKTLKALHIKRLLLHVKKVTSHTFRKTFARLALDKIAKEGGNPIHVMRALNHSSLIYTYYYAGYTDEEIQEVKDLGIKFS